MKHPRTGWGQPAIKTNGRDGERSPQMALQPPRRGPARRIGNGGWERVGLPLVDAT